MTLKSKFNIDTTKFFLALLFSFVVIQVTSWLFSELGIMPLIKLGWVLLLFLVIIGIISLFTLGKKLGQLDLKRDLPFILLVFVGIIILFIFLPHLIPQIFSTKTIEMGEVIKETINTIIGLSQGGNNLT